MNDPLPRTFRECVEQGRYSTGTPMRAAHQEAYRKLLDDPPPTRTETVMDCIYRGRELRRDECPTCGGGKVKIAIFTCRSARVAEMETAIAVKLEGIACCRLCSYYRPPDEEQGTQ